VELLETTPKGYFLRILGLDYGEKRIGVAICDELGLTAQGLSTIIRKNKKHDWELLGNLVKNYQVDKIVIGYPLKLDGSAGIQCEKVDRFTLLLEKAFALPVVKWQETLSTKEAEEILINSGVRWEKRKKMVDKLAACLILQNYLDSISK
jgi:putative holliday junction resolvase